MGLTWRRELEETRRREEGSWERDRRGQEVSEGGEGRKEGDGRAGKEGRWEVRERGRDERKSQGGRAMCVTEGGLDPRFRGDWGFA